MKKLLLTFLIILFTLTSNVVWSADYNKGWDAYDSGDYAIAGDELENDFSSALLESADQQD